MEWSLTVNEMLPHEITKIGYSLLPPGFEGDVRSIRQMQDSIGRLINYMGELSSSEQGLNKVITSSEKLRTADCQVLYLYKDANANNGTGEVRGMLKIGRKHLFLFDDKGVVHEVEPLCVLDFYVLRECQRLGIGKMLFEHMLEDLDTSAQKLAVDGPSEKMEAFLAKNYGMARLVRQKNNFAVSPRFFDSLIPDVRCWKRRKNIVSGDEPSSSPRGAIGTPFMGGIGRYTAFQPQSTIGSVIHGAAINMTSEEMMLLSDRAAAIPAFTHPVMVESYPPVLVEMVPQMEHYRSPERPRTLSVAAPAPPPERAAGHSAPGAAGRSAPGAAGLSAPGAAGRSAPGAAGRSAPGAARRSAPGAAGPSAPGAAGRSAPGAAGRSAPGAAGRSAPGAAGRSAPGAAGRSAPGAAGRSAPGAAGPSAPEAAGPSAPGAGEAAGPAGPSDDNDLMHIDGDLPDKAFLDIKFHHNRLW